MKIEVLKALFENHRTPETALSRRQITIEFIEQNTIMSLAFTQNDNTKKPLIVYTDEEIDEEETEWS